MNENYKNNIHQHRMTDEQTIKALECCMNDKADCNRCPFDNVVSDLCVNSLLRNALDLINHLKEKNEDLERIVGLMNKRKYYRKFVDEVFRKQKGNELTDPDFDYIYQLYFEQKAEIERLKAEVEKQKERTNDVIRSYVEDEWN